MQLAGKHRILLVIGISAVLIVVSVIEQSQNTDYSLLTVADKSFTSEFVDDDVEKEKGLSGRESLADDAAMVFVFKSPDVRCFWMKDMRFALDIVWLNANKQVNAIERNITPDTYPESFCHVDAQYVVEFAAGTAQELDLDVGDTFSFTP